MSYSDYKRPSQITTSTIILRSSPLVIHLKPQFYHVSRDHPTTARRPVGFALALKVPTALTFHHL